MFDRRHARLSSWHRFHLGPKQVRTLRGIRPGRIYRSQNKNMEKSLILALSKPFQDDNGKWWFEYTIWPGPGRLCKMSCADYSIVPYSNGIWNNYWALFRTRWRPRTKEELAEIRSRLGQESSLSSNYRNPHLGLASLGGFLFYLTQREKLENMN